MSSTEVRRGVRRQTRATLLAALRTRDHSESHEDTKGARSHRKHTPVQRGTQMKRQAERGGSRNGKTTDRLSEYTVGSHCRHRHCESVPHITGSRFVGSLIAGPVAARLFACAVGPVVLGTWGTHLWGWSVSFYVYAEPYLCLRDGMPATRDTPTGPPLRILTQRSRERTPTCVLTHPVVRKPARGTFAYMHFMHPTGTAASLRPCAQPPRCSTCAPTCVYAPDTEYSPGTDRMSCSLKL